MNTERKFLIALIAAIVLAIAGGAASWYFYGQKADAESRLEQAKEAFRLASHKLPIKTRFLTRGEVR